ncbi:MULTISPECIES: signal peptidase I [Enterobacterales]|jgi:signal peptidase I|uniref:Signal peptidase I n=4 Tax=Morganellaceae TaxID=1903414 RepID=A0A899NG66_PROST|nr:MULTISPECIES: signal peptidase I [Enterobacterales]URQ57461.1 Signal peptidase I [Providencia alcalifaciens]EKH6496462.1 signal peptidase I [Providencia rettgeri]ELB1110405.1 signal peptidase I [Morganella morganii]ELL8907411.1 signal peptidase I [Proteus mirabilis]ELQ1457987.1 signal peptidase I [Providencia rettgeri]
MNGLGILFVGLVAVLGRDVIKRRKPQPWLVIALALSVTLFVSDRWIGSIYSVPTGSMQPTYKVGDYVTAVRLGGLLDDGRLMRGDVAVFKAPSVPRTLYTKRIIGIPGDVVEFDTDKTYRVNGRVLGQKTEEKGGFLVFSACDERTGKPYRFVIDTHAAYVPTKGRWVIPEGYYFMAGDNRDHSWDSRYWENPPGTPKPLRGLVPHDRIHARVIHTLFNFNPFNNYDALDVQMAVIRQGADGARK